MKVPLLRKAVINYRSLKIFLIEQEYRFIISLEKRLGRSCYNEDLFKNCTILIKSYERPKTVTRLINSIKLHYPHIGIIVVDDSRRQFELDGVKMIHAPVESGLSYGRNLGVQNIRTKYFILLDDDMFMPSSIGLEQAYLLMQRFPNIDIMGGNVVDLPFFSKRNFYGLFEIRPDRKLKLNKGKHKGQLEGMPIVDITTNFFIAKTDAILRNLWDERLYVLEHEDFFLRAKGNLLTVFNKNISVLHGSSELNSNYTQRRYEVKHLRYYLEVKHNLKWEV